MFDHGRVRSPSGLAAPLPDDALGALAARVRPVALARQQQLPVLPALAPLLPGAALRRGSTVSIAPADPPGPPAPSRVGAPDAGLVGPESAVGGGPGAGGATSLALALAAGPSQAGSWVAAVGLGSLGLVAAAGLGIALDRLVLVDEPERRQWATVVAALVDGFDMVLVAAGPRARRRPADARRLAARVRERGAVLVAVGGELPERSHVRLSVEAGTWEGLGPAGCGHLTARRVVVVAGGRGEAARPRRAELWLPSDTGGVEAAEPVAPAVPFPSSRSSSRSPGGGLRGGGEAWDDLVGTAG